MRIEKVESLPKFLAAVKSIYSELGESFNKHATIQNLSRHAAKNDRVFVRETVRAFIKTGVLRAHRTDTFSWTYAGLEYAKRVLSRQRE